MSEDAPDQLPRGRAAKSRPAGLADIVYERLKQDIFEFRLVPGDRFSEGEISERMAASRTPVRQALYRLQREGFVEVQFRSGWQVRPFDFRLFEDLYDLRIVLEAEAVRRLCELSSEQLSRTLEKQVDVWLVPAADRLQDGRTVSALDEAFHMSLVEATGNLEMARIHRELTEKMRIVRRLDFTKAPRVSATYDEHGKILRAVLQRRGDEARRMLKAHIEASKVEVRKITLHMLHMARTAQEDVPAGS